MMTVFTGAGMTGPPPKRGQPKAKEILGKLDQRRIQLHGEGAK